MHLMTNTIHCLKILVLSSWNWLWQRVYISYPNSSSQLNHPIHSDKKLNEKTWTNIKIKLTKSSAAYSKFCGIIEIFQYQIIFKVVQVDCKYAKLSDFKARLTIKKKTKKRIWINMLLAAFVYALQFGEIFDFRFHVRRLVVS